MALAMVTLSPAFLSGQTMGDVNPLSQNLSQLPPAFAGSVPAGKASSTVLELSLHDALDLSLKQNLGLIEGTQDIRSAQAARLRTLSKLLPDINARIAESVQQNNLAAFGLPPFPGVPQIVGPFSLSDARASLSQSVLDLSAWNKEKSASLDQRAAQLSYADAREIVVVVVADMYLQAVASSARVDAAQSQLATAQATYDQAINMRKAGVVAGIDVLRSQVELKQQQQRLLAQENQLAKDKLALGRAIGLPPGQEFTIAESAPYSPLAATTADQALRTALEQRPDYQSAKAQVRAAEEAVKAAHAERYPIAGVTADYGDVGPTIANSHGTFTLAGSVKFNIYGGGRISGDITQAKANLKQRQDDLADLGGQIDYQVRTALLDIQSAADQVAVAESNLQLANQTLDQARDRFSAGVADTIEVVQAQESVASANDNLISSLYSHNLAKVALARALGSAEQGIRKFVEVK